MGLPLHEPAEMGIWNNPAFEVWETTARVAKASFEGAAMAAIGSAYAKALGTTEQLERDRKKFGSCQIVMDTPAKICPDETVALLSEIHSWSHAWTRPYLGMGRRSSLSACPLRLTLSSRAFQL